MKAKTIGERLARVRSQIAHAERDSARPEGSVCLLAVSKTQPPEALIAAYRQGQRHFGENYLQEAVDKQNCLANYCITWHFIGPIQSNKTRIIANRFSWVHGVDRIKIAQRLNQQRQAESGLLNVCLQINIDEEATKSGILPGQLPEFAAEIAALPNLRFRGLMTIPAATEDTDSTRAAFRRMREAFEDLRAQGYRIDTLSMGMSGDLEIAIAEGSTLVRVGTAVFGARR